MNLTLHHLMELPNLLGYAAASLVLVTFYVRSIRMLRTVAIASNLMFIAYGVAAKVPPVLVLHALLLPLNAWRLREANDLHALEEPPKANR